jgi:hypothetical protein
MQDNETPERWPDGSRRSTNNGFTHGYGSRPHGFKPGLPAVPIKSARRRAKPTPITVMPART